MSRNTTTLLIVGVIIVLVAVVGLGLAKSHPADQTMTPQATPDVTGQVAASSTPEASTGAVPGESASPAAMSEHVVTITSTGFSPASLTIKPGETVTWMNSDSALHQVNSDPHPTHTDYPPLNTISKLTAGQEKSLSFPTAGTYGYHDHLNPSFRGTIVVE